MGLSYQIFLVFGVLYPTFSIKGMISIRGHSPVQHLPFSAASNWPSWTFDKGQLKRVEDSLDDDGWVNPLSFENLYFPSDLPIPLARPSLGVVVTSGTPRYIMPSVILTVETPDRLWRNRGLCSLPRARAWIDLFSVYVPPIKNIRLYSYGQSTPDLRFLEDQDGSASWESIHLDLSNLDKNNENMQMFRPTPSEGFTIVEALEELKLLLKSSNRDADNLRVGYHYVDIPLGNKLAMKVPENRIKLYLTDLDDPKRLIDMEGQEELEDEPIGELDVTITQISAGGASKFLPEVYFDLFDTGNIML